MMRRLLFVIAFLIIFSAFVFLAFTYENEKSNVYLMQKDQEYALAAIDTDELYVYGVMLEDELTLTNGTNYSTFGELKDDPELMQYLSYTFSLEDIRFLNVNDPDYGSIFANFSVDQTKGSYEEFDNSLKDLPNSYISSYNVQYLRLAKLAGFSSEGYMDEDILVQVINGEDDGDKNTITKPVTPEMIREVFINIESIPLTCSNDICLLETTQVETLTSEMGVLLNEKLEYITVYEGIEAK